MVKRSKKNAFFPQKCSLEMCGREIGRGEKVIGALLVRAGIARENDMGKLDYICFSHVDSD